MEQVLKGTAGPYTGDARIIIPKAGMLETSARSSDGKVDFAGDMPPEQDCSGTKRVPVEAHPDAGYEVNYFYRPANQPEIRLCNPEHQSSMC